MGKAETASRNKTFLALRIAVKRLGRNSGGLVSVAVLLGIVFFLSDCGARGARAGRATASVIVERGCIVSVALTDSTECAGADLNHLRCTGLLMTWKPGCEKLRVQR